MEAPTQLTHVAPEGPTDTHNPVCVPSRLRLVPSSSTAVGSPWALSVVADRWAAGRASSAESSARARWATWLSGALGSAVVSATTAAFSKPGCVGSGATSVTTTSAAEPTVHSVTDAATCFTFSASPAVSVGLRASVACPAAVAVRTGATSGLPCDAMATSTSGVASCDADHAVAVLEETVFGEAAADRIAPRHGDTAVAGVALVAGGILAGAAPATLALVIAVEVVGLNGSDIVLATLTFITAVDTAAVRSAALGTSLVDGGHGHPWDEDVTGPLRERRPGAGCALAERSCPLATSSCLKEDVSHACHRITGINHDGTIIDTRCARGTMELRSSRNQANVKAYSRAACARSIAGIVSGGGRGCVCPRVPAPFRPDIAPIAGLLVSESGGVNEGCWVDRLSRIVL